MVKCNNNNTTTTTNNNNNNNKNNNKNNNNNNNNNKLVKCIQPVHSLLKFMDLFIINFTISSNMQNIFLFRMVIDSSVDVVIPQ